MRSDGRNNTCQGNDITIAQLRFWREECEWSYRDISEHTGIPATTIASRCQKLNLYPKNKVIARDRWRNRPKLVKHGDISPELIRRLYWDEENSSTEVSEILGIPKRSLITVMAHHGIPRRDKKAARQLVEKKGRANRPVNRPTPEEARQNGIKSGIIRRERFKRIESSEPSENAA